MELFLVFSENWYFEFGETYICGYLCVTSLIFCICPPNPWVLFSGLDRQVYSVARLCPDQSFLSLCHQRCVAGLSMLIWTLITVCSASFLLLLLAFDRIELRPQLIHWSLKYQGVERPNLLGLSCRLRLECGITFPTLCLTQERWMGISLQSTVGCFPELCFLQFSVLYSFIQVLVGLRNQFKNNFVFSTWRVLLVLIMITVI